MARILVVDYHMACYWEKELREKKHEVASFHSCIPAYKQLQSSSFDFAIIDCSTDNLVKGNRTLVEVLKEDYPSIVRIGVTAEIFAQSDPVIINNYQHIFIKPIWKEEELYYLLQ